MGERLGRYSVLRHLASGGMADVLIARSDGIEGFERHVVLKRIRAEHAKDQRFITMFLDEARVAANLHHQNIVQVHDIGEDNGEYFFAMEYIHGEDLRKLLSAVSKTRSHMPLGLVVAIVAAAAAGLHYAHERRDTKGKSLGIVHRDVSPSNILIGYDGAVKVVDFGIAKAAMRQVETRSGSLKGKVAYMSPEQCKGEEIDQRSDVYALGVLLYELATTTRLFKGDNDYLVMDAIVNGKVPPPRSRRGDLPNALVSVIAKALATDRERRYQTADELRIALDRFAIKSGLTASTSALATYMHQMFGERPEPWLDTAAAEQPNIDAEGPTQAAQRSWVELPRASGDDDTQQAVEPVTQSGKRPRRSGISNAVAVADTLAPPISTRETRTSLKLGWESAGKQPPASRTKLVGVALAVVVLAGVGVWQLTRNRDDVPQVAAARGPEPVAAAPAPAPAAPSAEVAPATRDIPMIRVAGADPASPIDEPAEPAEPPHASRSRRHAAPKHVTASDASRPSATRPATKLSSSIAKSPQPTTPTSSVSTTKPVAGASSTGSGTVAVPPAVPPPVPAVAPAPPKPQIIEAPMPVLSNGIVSSVASDHAAQLARCEGAATLHGDVAVTFQIDGTGKVAKSQLASSIKNARVAGCILKAVQSWKFPRPPTGSARGVYSISYQ